MSVKKIVVIGPESTGKSTLSKTLADSLDTKWVPEYARQYLENLGRPYNETDILYIGEAQLKLEDEIIASANEYLICDTDLYVLKVWGEHKYGRCNKWILEQIAARTYDMYLLTDIDIEWQDDPLREHPAPEERMYFYNVYRDIVTNSGVAWASISGSMDNRKQTALEAVKNMFKNRTA